MGSIEITNGKPGWLYIDIMNAVYKWRILEEGRKPNYGIILISKGDTENIGIARFASSGHENVTIRPRLFICLSILGG